MQALTARASGILRRSLYGSLLAGYTLYLISILNVHGPSEGGWVPVIGRVVNYTPLAVLLIQTIHPNRVLWWLMSIACAAYAALLAFLLWRLAWLGPNGVYNLIILIWVCGVLYVDRPRARHSSSS